MKRCPKCNGQRFLITQHVTQTVLVDENESYIETVSDCDEITHRADDEDLWQCEKCGYEATGNLFNVNSEE